VERRTFLRLGAGGVAAGVAGVFATGQLRRGRVPPPAGIVRTSWATDPWARGSYSYLPVGASPQLRRDLAAPVGGRLFLAGEATDTGAPATVHGAGASGRRASDQVLAVAGTRDVVVVVGAGLAGLTAAAALQRAGLEVRVVEARDRIGGRLDTIEPEGWPLPVERGASWVHDRSASTLADDLAEVGSTTVPFPYEPHRVLGPDGEVPASWLRPAARAVDGALGWAADRSVDRSLAAALEGSGRAEGVDPSALDHHLDVEVVAEHGADASQLSAWYAFDEGSVGTDLLVVGGYARLADRLAADLDVQLSRPVVGIGWDGDGVTLVGVDGGTERADRVVVTVPLGVLAAGGLAFDPPLPSAHESAIAGLGSGLLDKVWLRFDEPFWQPGALLWTRVAPGEAFRQWYDLSTLTGAPVLVALHGGTPARRWAQASDGEVTAAALAALEGFVAAGW
jgi:monoamine oxidase